MTTAHDATGRRPRARTIGTETEFGIVAVDDPDASPVHTSTQAVVAYARTSGQGVNRRTRWDYTDESPLRDVRGYDLRRYRTAPVLDPNAPGVANVVTTSGARFYVDHAHPEYSSPEVTDARQAVVWDKAGELLMHEAARASGGVDGQPHLKIYKNNVDGKGASYGAHENYLHPRDYSPDDLQAALVPHFVTRQVYTGAGRVGLGETGRDPGFQISQRADYIETTVSLETTLNRGIVNTRDEPHADERWRRLHVIIGDANLSETATYLKVGTTALLLDAVGAGVDLSDLALYDPVADVRRVSRDLTCREELRLYGNGRMSAVEIQREIRRRIADAVDRGDIAADDTDRDVLRVWGEVLDDLAADPARTAGRLDWTAKLSLLEGYRRRGLDWDHPTLALVDIQYHDIDPAKGLYNALVAKGRMRTLVDPGEVRAAVTQPPSTTRAWLRGTVVDRFAPDLLAASWDALILDTPFGSHPATHVAMPEPCGSTAAELAALCADGPDVATFVRRLAEAAPDRVSGIG